MTRTALLRSITFYSLSGNRFFSRSSHRLSRAAVSPYALAGRWRTDPVASSAGRAFTDCYYSSISSSSIASPYTEPPPETSWVDYEVEEKLGFEKVSEEFIGEYKSKAVLFKHKKTGAEVMSLSNDDENKVFGIVFRTPPNNSTGVAHILEHSVMCGSRKYPLKSPFVELTKGSLHTFLNAFTYPDRTCYPVASTNTKDFYNLIDVYLDAVFFPNCVKDFQTFQQEGWHYELNDPSEEISYKGVVFNEMKGVYSRLDNILERASQQALFPDNTYSVTVEVIHE